MIEGGNQTEAVTTQGNFTGFQKQVKGVGFSLVPASRGAKYPVHVYLDQDQANPVVVTNAGWQGSTPFNSLKVNVTPGGGVAGDEWRLFIKPEADDGEEPRARTDDRGNTVMRVAPPVPLLQQNFGGEFSDRTIYLPSLAPNDHTPPDNPAARGDIVDVSAYRFVKLTAWCQNGLDSVTIEKIQLFLECSDSPFMSPREEVAAGTANQLAEATPDAGSGYVMVGEVAEYEGANERRYGTRFNYVRPKLVIEGTVSLDGDIFVELWGYP